MTFIKFFIFSLLLIPFFVSGCVTFDAAKPEDVAQVRSSMSEQIRAAEYEMSAVKGQIEELDQKVSKLSQQQSGQAKELNYSLKEMRGQVKDDLKEDLAGLKKQMSELQARQEKDRNELENKLNIIVQEVSNENKELRKQIEAIRKSSSSPAVSGTASGNCHIVAPGDTLSNISKAYGISMQNLMNANNISDPNSIKVGQKLVIPEKL